MKKNIVISILSFTALMVVSCSQPSLKSEIAEKYSNGSKKKEVYFYKSVTDPRRVIYYDSITGKVKSDQFMLNGKPDSTTTIYYGNGQKYKEITYIQDKKTRKEMIHGKEMKWYENGQVEFETNYDHGTPVGTSVSYFSDGTKASETSFVNGVKSGTETMWYSNGKMKKQVNYTNGNMNGTYKEWYETGNPKREDTFVNDVLDGTSIMYHPNGKKETECVYKAGKLNGIKQEWRENGKIAARATYENGQLIEGERF
ncbi:MAG: toxin-antitoxin system YwqK family antitoxin [Chitinivibrionales bacterium]|nr:toxin-antitoxin system YwqK family antitoxin [Chitinivibrionales bacterium]